MMMRRRNRRGFTYKAFISYSHSADGKLAPAVQKALQTFGKPWYRIRTFSVFRDDTDLSVSPALWPAIEKALGKTEYLLLFASRQSAGSRWVEQELEFWIKERPLKKLLIVLTDGKIAWDLDKQDFDWSTTTSLPKILTGAFKAEPLYLDLSWCAHSGVPLSLRHVEFRKAILRLTAAITERRISDIDSDELRQHRRNMRAAWIAMVILILTSAIAATASVLFVKQRDEALRQARTAISRQIAAEARAQVRERLDLSLLLSCDASGIEDNLETRAALLECLQSRPRIRQFYHGLAIGEAPMATHPGKPVIALGTTQGIEFHNWRTGESLGAIPASGNGVAERLAYSPDGLMVASSHGGNIFLWDAATLEGIGHFSVDASSVLRLDFCLEGAFVAVVTGDSEIVLSELATRTRVSPKFSDGPAVAKFDWISSPPMFATATEAGDVALWNGISSEPSARMPIREGTESFVRAMELSPGGEDVAIAYSDGLVRLWQPATNQWKDIGISLGDSDQVMRMAFSASGKTLAIASAGGEIWCFEVSTAKVKEPAFQGHRLAVGDVMFSSEESVFISAGWDGKAIVWDLERKPPLARREFHLDAISPNPMMVEALAVDDGDAPMASVFIEGGKRTVIDLAAMNEVTSPLEGGDTIEMDPTGRWILVKAQDQMMLRDLASGVAKPLLGGNQVQELTYCFSQDGKWVAMTDLSGLVRVFQTGTAKEVCAPFNHGADARLAIAPDASFMVTAGADGLVKMWSLPEGRPIAPAWKFEENSRPVSLTISPDGRLLATGSSAVSGSFVQLWNLPSGRANGPRMLGHRGPVRALAFRPDGKLLASGGMDSPVVLWDVEHPRPSGLRLKGNTGGVVALRFSKDGKELFAGDNDGGIIGWNVDVECWRAEAAEVANRALTDEERLQYVGEAKPEESGVFKWIAGRFPSLFE